MHGKLDMHLQMDIPVIFQWMLLATFAAVIHQPGL